MPSSSAEQMLSVALSKVKYRHPDMTRRDVLNALHHYRGLAPRQEKFIFNDGMQRDLISLTGTIPVPYKGQNYNIPVAIWLLDTHPYNAPLFYVKPTQDMQIKVSKHVDSAGKIYLPYLHDWTYPKSDLIGLIQICIITFSEQPPVYSKPKEDPQRVYQAGYSYSGYNQPQRPGMVPYWPGGGAQPVYPPQSGGGYPPYPPTSTTGGGVYPPTSSSGYPPYPPTTSGYTMPQPSNYYQGSTGMPGGRPPNNGGTITQEHIKASILSAVEDKVRRRINEEFASKQAESESLKKIAEDLSSGKDKLTEMLAKLSDESQQLDTDISTLDKKKAELNEMTEKLESAEDIDIDEAVNAPAPLFRQLISAFAEESATEDALYFLGEALRRGVIDCDTFLKHVRNLSRRQFLMRATMQQCRQKAGLPV